ncbi:putative signaling protein [bioreactor metagenome]|uniref:Putative signaling protein n=1 Tax=bioreactor metagenome TaxID=1076179 RepID=A0A645CC13_9ZZZZ
MVVLLRFQCPEFGFVSPGEFIPIAERTGLILRIDELVMRRSFEFLNRHNVREDLGISTIEVNLSAAEFINQGFYDRFIQIYEHYRVDPDLVIFEITETAATISCEVMIEYMEILNKFGIKFALDDFGKGYANLTQVVNLPFSIVKLDRSLLVGKYEGEKNGIVFEDIMNMFKRLGMAIVVEGVESLEDVNQVIDLNPNYIQGFYYAKPMPENELIPFLKKANNKFYC